MDFMELERERGITIQSAATYASWKDSHINVIDTPGHVDFTVEVERALRVLDGAVLVLCAASGVQSQTLTVNRQMIRYKVPRIAFINKLDRSGADPWRVVQQLREKLRLNAIPLQAPIGVEKDLDGVVDLITMEAVRFTGRSGEEIVRTPVEAEKSEELKKVCRQKRQEMVEALADLDDELATLFLDGKEPSPDLIRRVVRKATIDLKMIPVMMGASYKNKGVQLLLDGVVSYLPNPSEKPSVCLDLNNDEKPFDLVPDANKPLVALAFKLEEGKFGQLTYVRVYQGTVRKGMFIKNTANNKKVKIPRLVRMHANHMEDVEMIGPGEICALFGVECNSGDTFTAADAANFAPSMMSMFVPEPVMSLALLGRKSGEQADQLSKGLSRFQREDPTFRVTIDPESKDTIISGMGELHLDVYCERLRREYKVDVKTGPPRVNYRETIGKRTEFSHLHKKQTGGAGQFARVIGYVEPFDPYEADEEEEQTPTEESAAAAAAAALKKKKSKSLGTAVFENAIVGNVIPPEYITAIEKGVAEGAQKGVLVGAPIMGVRFVLTDGQAHAVDSSEMAFRTATKNAMREAMQQAQPQLMEPIMKVSIAVPEEYQGAVVGNLNRRRGNILESNTRDGTAYIEAEVPLGELFGYSTDLRASTQAKGEFTMEYLRHQLMNRNDQERVVKEHLDKLAKSK